MSKSELETAVEAAGVTIEATHLYVDWSNVTGYHAPVDRWAVTLRVNDKSETFTFMTGIGHRKLVKGAKSANSRAFFGGGPPQWETAMGNRVTGWKEALAKRLFTLVPPKAADVLYGLLSEMSANEQSFDNWAADFGGDTDSLKSLNTYLACQKSGDKVCRLLGYQLASELRNKDH